MVEMRADLTGFFDAGGMDALATFRGEPDLSLLPDGFSGMIDVGEAPRPDCGLTVVSSRHDYSGTPPAGEIAAGLSAMEGDIAKGAFMVNRLSDLSSIFRASRMIRGRRVLLGMGELGAITRIRGDVLGNEFTFAYVGEPTAPGQLSLREMLELGEGCMVTGLLGHPLSKSLSPAMHAAAYAAAGIRGAYLRFDAESPDGFADVMRDYRVRGLNVTVPFKERVAGGLDRLDPVAERLGAVNAIVNDEGSLTGYNTDAEGVRCALADAGFRPKGARALVIGYGGGARACAYALAEAGCEAVVTGRSAESAARMASEMGLDSVPAGEASVKGFDLVANCTPVGMYGGSEYPVSLDGLSESHFVFDMAYGSETPIIRAAVAAGGTAVRGEEMLAAQGAESFRLWTGSDQREAMRRAVVG
jgi:shikimate dehydrogenase